MNWFNRLCGVFCLFCVFGMITGCETASRESITLEDAAYPALRERINSRQESIPEFRATVTTQMTWVDNDGKFNFEDGGGPLMYRFPRDFSLTLGKLGVNVARIGSNSKQYWMIDLRDPKQMWIGRHGGPGEADFPMLTKPNQLAWIIGLINIPESLQPRIFKYGKETSQEKLIIEYPPDPTFDGMALHLLVDAFSGQIHEMVLFQIAEQKPENNEQQDSENSQSVDKHEKPETWYVNPKGMRWVFAAKMSEDWIDVQESGKLPGPYRRIPSRVIVTSPDLELNMSINFELAFSGPGVIKDRFFDWKLLIDQYEIDQVMSLDKASVSDRND